MARMLLLAPPLLLLVAAVVLIPSSSAAGDGASESEQAAAPPPVAAGIPSSSAAGDSEPEQAAASILQAPPPASAAAQQYDQETSSSSPNKYKKKGNYKGMSREFVDGHNEVRARYGAPPLEWDNKLALYARRWAKAMGKECLPKHSRGMYGESIYLGRNGWNATAKDALYMWEAEEPTYDKATGNCTHGHLFDECGHFAIMVNKRYLWLGCGRAECDGGKGVFISCNYYFNRPSSSSSSPSPSPSDTPSSTSS